MSDEQRELLLKAQQSLEAATLLLTNGYPAYATFKLANINRKKLEALIQRFFSDARLDVQLQDRFGIPVNPREWFLVPLEAIEAAIKKIKEGTIDRFRYDLKTASLTQL